VRLKGRRLVVAVSGSIAAYRAPDILRALQGLGAEVQPVMTASAQRFLSPLVLETLTGRPVASDPFQPWGGTAAHVGLARWADAILIAPATADLIARLAQGRADDLIGAMFLAARSPVIVAPAMNVRMYAHPSTQANLQRLREMGVRVVEPAEGELACGEQGRGRLAEVADIVEEVLCALSPQDLAGISALVTAGPTQEDLDPVRFISNRSSGRMGYALARVAHRRGARVVLVSGPTALEPPSGVELVRVRTVREMYQVVMERAKQAQVVIKAAAVADFRPRHPLEHKLKKAEGGFSLELERTPDILAELGRRRAPGQTLVGFAAETEPHLLGWARRKLEAKGLDLVVANRVNLTGSGFQAEHNQVAVLDRHGRAEQWPLLPKEEVAERIWDWVAELRRSGV